MAEEREDQARQGGWVPQEEWKGDPDRWVSADTFVERGEKSLPIQKQKLDRALAENQVLKGEVSEIKESVKEFESFTNQILENTVTKYKEQITQLKADKKEAAAEGNMAAYDQLDGQIEELQEVVKNQVEAKPKEVVEEKPTQPQATPEQQELLVKFATDNPWYATNRVMAASAEAISKELLEKDPTLSGQPLLDKIVDGVKENFPHQFENDKRERDSIDSGGKPRGGNLKGQGYDNLDPEAKAACDKFVKTIPGYTVEKYLKVYFEGEG